QAQVVGGSPPQLEGLEHVGTVRRDRGLLGEEAPHAGPQLLLLVGELEIQNPRPFLTRASVRTYREAGAAAVQRGGGGLPPGAGRVARRQPALVRRDA